jgi:hypothetical protein
MTGHEKEEKNEEKEEKNEEVVEMSDEVEEGFGDALASLLGALSKEMEENPLKMESDFEYPMEISGIKNITPRNVNTHKTGSLVQVRPCSDKYEEKTYLGIYIGEVPIESMVALNTRTNVLDIMSHSNPAIFVPELKKVIFGCESWWGYIRSEEELKQITNKDIEDVWYVQLLKEMGKKDEKGKGTEAPKDD